MQKRPLLDGLSKTLATLGQKDKGVQPKRPAEANLDSIKLPKAKVRATFSGWKF